MCGDVMSGVTWRIFGDSVRGASHVRQNLPNQDAINWFPGQGQGLPLILAVSDGHGSAKCIRSDRGAEFAVDAAIKTLKCLIERQAEGESLSALKRWAEEQGTQRMIQAWRTAVEADIRDDPLPAAVDKPLLAYGATLLAVLAAETFLMYWQLGDGDILTLADNGEIQRPVPPDDRLIANETTSLCAKDAWKDFRFRFQQITDAPPQLILLATDGYANSFKHEAGFLQVAADFGELIRAEGLDYVERQLPVWLNEATGLGSGDDITVGVMWRETY